MIKYLQKRAHHGPFISINPPLDLGLVVVIPSFAEEFILSSLGALLECDLPDCATEVIIVFNETEGCSEESKELNQKGFEEISNWAQEVNTPKLSFYPIYPATFPQKKGGVGLARKTGMDEAVRRYQSNQNDGILACFDADSRCAKNYLLELWEWYSKDEKNNAISIYYEHPFDKLDEAQRNGIVLYESHLRYFVDMQANIGLPFAYQTVGSAMAVKASSYCKEGGMPVRKAGEDFYFLHKFIKNDNCTNLTSTTIYPSARVSDRVPFGTGRAIGDFMENGKLTTYDYRSFEILKVLIENLNQIYQTESIGNLYLHEGLSEFLISQNATQRIREIKGHTSDYKGFLKRFYQWFDAFLLMKYLHYMRDNYFENISIEEGMKYLFEKLKLSHSIGNAEENLQSLRQFDKNRET